MWYKLNSYIFILLNNNLYLALSCLIDIPYFKPLLIYLILV